VKDFYTKSPTEVQSQNCKSQEKTLYQPLLNSATIFTTWYNLRDIIVGCKEMV